MKILVSCLLLAAFVSMNSEGSEFRCETFYGEIALQISGDRIALKNYNDKDRKIASNRQVAVATNNTSYKSVFYKKGIQHKVYIHDVSNFSEDKDYLSITNTKGHKVTYPLICE